MFIIISDEDFMSAIKADAYDIALTKISYRERSNIDGRDTYDTGDQVSYRCFDEVVGDKVKCTFQEFFTSDKKFLDIINNTLETEYIGCFRAKDKVVGAFKDENDSKINDVSLDGERFYLITKSGKVLCFTNSEWGGIQSGRSFS